MPRVVLGNEVVLLLLQWKFDLSRNQQEIIQELIDSNTKAAFELGQHEAYKLLGGKDE